MSVLKIESIRHPMGEGMTGTVTGRNDDNQIVKIVVAWHDWKAFTGCGATVGDRVRYSSDTRVWGRV